MSCIGHDITLVSQPGQTVLTDHPELYMNSKNDFLWQMPLWHVLFLCPRCGACGGVRPLCPGRGQALCPRWGQALCLRWGQASLSEMGSGPLARDGVRHLCLRRGQALCQRGGVRPPCQRWGQAPLPAVGSDPIGDCAISALALYSALFYNSWCWWQHKYSIRW